MARRSIEGSLLPLTEGSLLLLPEGNLLPLFSEGNPQIHLVMLLKQFSRWLEVAVDDSQIRIVALKTANLIDWPLLPPFAVQCPLCATFKIEMPASNLVCHFREMNPIPPAHEARTLPVCGHSVHIHRCVRVAGLTCIKSWLTNSGVRLFRLTWVKLWLINNGVLLFRLACIKSWLTNSDARLFRLTWLKSWLINSDVRLFILTWIKSWLINSEARLFRLTWLKSWLINSDGRLLRLT